ncbi:MAG: hypothetical protein LBL74_00500 [Bacteroidales bacterium]|jgi:hypothetical protein|nr:hypothetical protein [Bacteroidales bacterium]
MGRNISRSILFGLCLQTYKNYFIKIKHRFDSCILLFATHTSTMLNLLLYNALTKRRFSKIKSSNILRKQGLAKINA